MVVLVTCKNDEIKAPELPQHLSHYLSMTIFPNTKGQLTLQSEVKSSPNSNSYEIS